jgi:hypothetical protein
VASFSGVTSADYRDPVIEALVIGAVPSRVAAFGEPAEPFGVLGNPLTDALDWYRYDPATLAPNFGGVATWLFVGNGLPCDARDVVELPRLHPPAFSAGDAYLKRNAARFDAAMRVARIPHVYDAYGCGVHSYRYVERDIHQWWGPMFAAFGKPPPSSFSYRGAETSLSVWGWTFQADPGRAREFLTVQRASPDGVTLAGSGVETVTTAAYFTPGESVELTGAREASATAGPNGRIKFTVSLGPPHRQQQYTLQARLAGEGKPGYFTTRQVGLAS